MIVVGDNIVGFQYFGDIDYFKKLCKLTDVVFPASVQFAKSDSSNRCRISGANGPIVLSVPLEKGRNQKTIFKEVKISNDEKWQLRHWKSIVSCYNGSPWFVHYKDELAGLYQEKFALLIDWNLACTNWIIQKLKLPVMISLVDEIPEEMKLNIPDLRNRSSEDGNEESSRPVIYNQVFMDKTGFIPNLSILDLLFCTGPKVSVELLG